MSNKLIFLDLEDTVIDSWDGNRLLVHLHQLRSFLRQHNAKQIGIFSFAIWIEKDKIEFDTVHFKGMIEKALDVEIIMFPSVQEMTKEIFWKHGTVFDMHETIAIWGKQRTFIDWCTLVRPANHCILVDDVIDNFVLTNTTQDIIIEGINVFSLE